MQGFGGAGPEFFLKLCLRSRIRKGLWEILHMEEQYKKVKKNKANALQESSHSGDCMHIKVKDKKRMKKKKDKICDDNESPITQSKDINVKDGAAEVGANNFIEEDQKKSNIDIDKNGKEDKKVRKKDKKISKDGEAVGIKVVSNEEAGVGEGNKEGQSDVGKDFEGDSRSEAREDRKKRHKKNQEKDGINSYSTEIIADKKLESGKTVKEQRSVKRDTAEINCGDEGSRKEKTKKTNKEKDASNVEGKESVVVEEKVGKASYNDENTLENDAKKVKKKRKKADGEIDVCAIAMEGDKKEKRKKRKLGKDGLEETVHGMEEGDKLEKKAKSLNDSSKGTDDKRASVTKISVDTSNLVENHKFKGTPKKVRFSSHVEIFPTSDDLPTSKKKKHGKGLVQGKRLAPEEDELVQGKRFAPEEDEMIKAAVSKYIDEHGLGEDGIDKVLHCKDHPEIRHCWKEIALALPQRPYRAIYCRGRTLFLRAKNRGWTPEEYEIIRRFHEQHGSDWKMLADELGKHRVHVKDTWRRIKLPNVKKGHWSQEEYQTLFNLVNMDLQMKAFEEKKSKHGMLRDNICWGAISDRLSTRITSTCCTKWYNQLTSPMVVEGKWADADDLRLLDVLFNLDACCIEDVVWDNLLEHRSGDVCRKRWTQMVKHIGEHGNKSFAEQIDVLLQRYRPDLLEAREEYARRPAVDEVK